MIDENGKGLPVGEIEHVLASIRRIIEEEDAAATPEAATAGEPTSSPPEEDVLELTQPLDDTTPLPEPPVAATTGPDLSTVQVRGYEGSDKTLEAVLRDLLRPVLQEWLDANLPEMVERLVTQEIYRITAQR